jgi:trehalose/maltose hydrolase-like predicted phosphorylase
MEQATYVQLYRHQVVKQADLVLAMQWCPESFTSEEKARNLDYYERRTVPDSSLSAGSQAVLCAEAGHLELAHDYLHEAALVDLRDLHASAASACTSPRWRAPGRPLSRGSAGSAWSVRSPGSRRPCRGA